MIHTPDNSGGSFYGEIPPNAWPLVRYQDVFALRRPHSDELLAICKITGNGLIEHGIYSGDYLIFRLAKKAKAGDLVIAAVPGGWTIKYYFPFGKSVRLSGANAEYEDQVWKNKDVQIHGIVKEVRRLL